jgi:hypothetical protein
MYPPRGLIGGSRPIGLAAPPPPLCYSTCGVVVVASGKPPSDKTLAPLRRGFFFGRALCKDGAGLSANLLGVVAHNLSDGRCWPGRPTLLPSVG